MSCREALRILLTTHILPGDSSTYFQLLHTCILTKALSQGKIVHSLIVQRRFAFATRTNFQNKLINFYVKCGSLLDARKVFDLMNVRNSISWNTIIGAYRQHGCPHESVTLFHQMQRTGFQPDQFTFAIVLRACAKMGALEQGMDIYQNIKDCGILSNVVVATALVDMLAKCGSIDKAHQVFDRIPQRDVISWNAMIVGYVHNGFVEKALETFKQMQLAGVKPDSKTVSSILPACGAIGALEDGMNIHQNITEAGFLSDVVVASALVDMYAKCGSMEKARKIFERVPQRDVILWTAMIAGYVQNGFVEKALQAFKQLQQTCLKPDSSIFASILPAFAHIGTLELGIAIHQIITESGFSSDIVVASALVDMYAKCGGIEAARELFDRMPQRDVVSWTSMIVGYAQNGLVEKALETFQQMQLARVKPNSTTFASILPACAKMGALEQGTDIHRSIMEGGFFSNVVVASALVDMYVKCGSIDRACKLFDKMHQRNVVSWNAMIAGYAQNGSVEKALDTFKQMQLVGVKPDSTTFASVLPACAKVGGLEQGMAIHQRITEEDFLLDVVLASALVDMYAKCASLDKAHEFFNKIPQRNVVSWNAMIGGYVQNGLVEKSLETFKQMQLMGVKPDSSTFSTIVSACAQIGALELGRTIHQIIIESGFWADVVVASALIDMYAKCGNIEKACDLFNRMPQRDVVSWNAVIVGYTQNGFFEKALETFKQMPSAGVKPNSTTFASILPACAKMGALEQGMDIHQSIMEGEYLSDVVVASALVDMYAKCGSIDKAHELFDKMPQRNVISWNTMIAGYAQNGFCEDALRIFELMKHSGIYPDNVSLASVLFACSHAGLVDEGCTYFNHMGNLYCMTPTVDHYVCMVDLLSRAGYLKDTLNFIIKIPVKPAVVVWMCFLGACRTHMNIGLGVFTAMLLSDLDPKNAATYVLLSNIYAEVGWWGEVQIVRSLMQERGIKKIPGCSWIEGEKMVHAFCAGDRSHPQTQEIYAELEKLAWEMKAARYFPDSKHSVNDVEEEEKESFICHHSEKLAIAFGLLNTPHGTTIRVVKNLRVCADCHGATKLISKIVAREIVVRDVNRFHHFKQGQCSCGDFW